MSTYPKFRFLKTHYVDKENNKVFKTESKLQILKNKQDEKLGFWHTVPSDDNVISVSKEDMKYYL